jgi:hypothetical protein
MSKAEIRQFKSILKQGILRKIDVSLDYKFQNVLLEIVTNYENLQQELDKKTKVLNEIKREIKLMQECSSIQLSYIFEKLLNKLEELEKRDNDEK